jgi:hypothetical protein
MGTGEERAISASSSPVDASDPSSAMMISKSVLSCAKYPQSTFWSHKGELYVEMITLVFIAS